MKKAFSVVFWVFSVMFCLMGLALLSASALSCVLLLACAVLINPIFIEKVQLKKSLTALLTIGLFIASVAVFPASEKPAAAKPEQSISSIQKEPQQTNEVLRSYDALQATSNDQTGLSEVEKSVQSPNPTETPSATPTSTKTPKPTSTPTKTPTKTPKPTATPTPKPTKTPKPTATPKPVTRAVGITILDYSDTVGRGEYAFIKIQGSPNTDYDCEVEYKSGMSSAEGLGVKQSDGNGNVSWKWKVGSRTSLDYTPTIYIDGGGDSISVDFEVVK
ncbi:MAG: hypothetical protein ABFC56_07565 [Clostridiaceae bacterium]